jgi:hypothetical protein
VQGIIVVLVQGIYPSQFIKVIYSIVVPVAVVNVCRRIEVKGDGSEWFVELVPELKVGRVDAESAVGRGTAAARRVHRLKIFVRGRGG